MHATSDELQKIANDAYLSLDTDDEITIKLAHDINTIMDYVGQLKNTNTQAVEPLIHPLDGYQPLRADENTDYDCTAKLAPIAPSFSDNLYLVPKVIQTGN